ncbi:MAG: nuclear transport factor 2 family protein [Acidimicrobiia bacterium]
MVLITLAVGVAAKFFGSRHRDADDDIQGDHPVVRAIFGAMNTGDFDGLEDLVDEECQNYANGNRLTIGTVDRGPDLVVGTLRAFLEALPDMRWELYDEVSEKKHRTEKVAIRFVSHATIDGEDRDIEVAVFAIVEDKKLFEWRLVVDMTLYNLHRAAVGLPPIE